MSCDPVTYNEINFQVWPKATAREGGDMPPPARSAKLKLQSE